MLCIELVRRAPLIGFQVGRLSLWDGFLARALKGIRVCVEFKEEPERRLGAHRKGKELGGLPVSRWFKVCWPSRPFYCLNKKRN